MADQVDALRKLGAELSAQNLPITISRPISGNRVDIAADTSSQFVSGLMLIGGTLPHGLVLDLDGDPVSRPYIEMTTAVLRSFGAYVQWNGNSIHIEAGGYEGRTFAIEPDASTATYPLAAAAIVGGRVRIPGLGSASIQGDVGFASVIESMGADLVVDSHVIEVRGSGELHSLDVNLGDMSDTAPTFAALAAKARGTSHATGIGFIRETKESDRVAGVVTELTRAGVEASVDDDGFTVVGGPHRDADIETYDDHRMAMAMALLGLTGSPISITNSECVAKTFPGYFDMLDELRAAARTTPLVLAIDGPAGSGKSTIARLMAARLNMPHLDTGAMYRAITWAVLDAGLSLDATDSVAAIADEAELWIGPKAVIVNDRDVTVDIRSAEVTANVSAVAANRHVRDVLVAQQQRWATRRGAAVIEGRDIGTAVFPDATLKIYLTASVAERARRRAAETGETDLGEAERAIERRDHIDSTREHDPLVVADDAIIVDSSNLTTEKVVDEIARLWNESHLDV
jgi:3-phosphoshikimate 1-carboxyvinyltransferase